MVKTKKPAKRANKPKISKRTSKSKMTPRSRRTTTSRRMSKASKGSAKARKSFRKPKLPVKKKAPVELKHIKRSIFGRNAIKPIKKAVPLPEVERKPTDAQKEDLKHISKILADSHIRQMLIELGGENALAIIRNFYGNHSDDELAKKLKLKISDVRATLNRLHNEGLVNYIREKDNETGWYSYSWSLNIQRMERWVSTQNSIGGFMKGDAGEEYYFCNACGASSIINFETASNWSFRCERCDRMLDFLDEKKMCELHEKKR